MAYGACDGLHHRRADWLTGLVCPVVTVRVLLWGINIGNRCATWNLPRTASVISLHGGGNYLQVLSHWPHALVLLARLGRRGPPYWRSIWRLGV